MAKRARVQKVKRIRKQSKLPTPKLARKLWELCKQIVRNKYGNECYTCGAKNLQGSNWHTAHLLPKASVGAYLKYDLRILRPCCYHCNINLGGNGAVFLQKMIIREGQDYVDGIFRDRALIVKARDHYEMLITKYQMILDGETNQTLKGKEGALKIAQDTLSSGEEE